MQISSTVGFSGRFAPGCQDFKSAALETTTDFECQARATNGFGDRRERSGGVPLVRDDDFEDEPSGNRLRDPSISFELSEFPPVARIDVADKKVWIESAQGVRGGESRRGLFRGQRDAEVGHVGRKIAAEFDPDVAAFLLAAPLQASVKRQLHGLFMPAAFGERVAPRQRQRPHIGLVRRVGPVPLILHFERVALRATSRPEP